MVGVNVGVGVTVGVGVIVGVGLGGIGVGVGEVAMLLQEESMMNKTRIGEHLIDLLMLFPPSE